MEKKLCQLFPSWEPLEAGLKKQPSPSFLDNDLLFPKYNLTFYTSQGSLKETQRAFQWRGQCLMTSLSWQAAASEIRGAAGAIHLPPMGTLNHPSEKKGGAATYSECTTEQFHWLPNRSSVMRDGEKRSISTLCTPCTNFIYLLFLSFDTFFLK